LSGKRIDIILSLLMKIVTILRHSNMSPLKRQVTRRKMKLPTIQRNQRRILRRKNKSLKKENITMNMMMKKNKREKHPQFKTKREKHLQFSISMLQKPNLKKSHQNSGKKSLLKLS
jgi:hypothetical protein